MMARSQYARAFVEAHDEALESPRISGVSLLTLLADLNRLGALRRPVSSIRQALIPTPTA